MATHSIPPVGFVTKDSAGALTGFRDFEKWMLTHDPLYKLASDSATIHGVGEGDRLRFLLWTMSADRARISNEWDNLVHAYQSTSPVVPMMKHTHLVYEIEVDNKTGVAIADSEFGAVKLLSVGDSPHYQAKVIGIAIGNEARDVANEIHT